MTGSATLKPRSSGYILFIRAHTKRAMRARVRGSKLFLAVQAWHDLDAKTLATWKDWAEARKRGLRVKEWRAERARCDAIRTTLRACTPMSRDVIGIVTAFAM